MSRRQRALGLLIVLVSGCTSSSSRTSSGSPSSVIHGSTSPAAQSSERAVTLSCADSGGGTLTEDAGPPLVLGALTFEGLRRTVTDVPRAVDVGLRLPAELAEWHFRKAPVYLPARAGSVTLRMSPNIAAAFAWVPAQLWTSGGGPDLSRWAATSVSFSSCADRTATYFGGFLADSTETCLRFQVGDHRGKNNVNRRLDGSTCSG